MILWNVDVTVAFQCYRGMLTSNVIVTTECYCYHRKLMLPRNVSATTAAVIFAKRLYVVKPIFSTILTRVLGINQSVVFYQS